MFSKQTQGTSLRKPYSTHPSFSAAHFRDNPSNASNIQDSLSQHPKTMQNAQTWIADYFNKGNKAGRLLQEQQEKIQLLKNTPAAPSQQEKESLTAMGIVLSILGLIGGGISFNSASQSRELPAQIAQKTSEMKKNVLALEQISSEFKNNKISLTGEDYQKKSELKVQKEDELYQLQRELGNLETNLKIDQDMTFLSGALGTMIGGLGVLSFGMLGKMYLKKQADIRAALKMAKDIEIKTLTTSTIKTPEEQRLSTVFTKNIQTMSVNLAARLQHLYDTEAEIRPVYDQTFGLSGGKADLPSAHTLKNLFTYFAFHEIKADLAHSSAAIQPKISQIELEKRTFVLMKVAQQMGDIFAFVKPDPKGPFGDEAFDQTLAFQSIKLRTQLETRIETFQSLVQKDLEADKHLLMAQKALSVGKLADILHPEKFEALKQIIEQFKQQKQKIQDVLQKPDILLNPQTKSKDTLFMDELNEEFNQLVAYLQAVLMHIEAEDSLEAQVNESILLHSTPKNTTAQTTHVH